MFGGINLNGLKNFHLFYCEFDQLKVSALAKNEIEKKIFSEEFPYIRLR